MVKVPIDRNVALKRLKYPMAWRTRQLPAIVNPAWIGVRE
jgi:hypothetical protein